mgnify:CR=1 FL=1
MTDKEILDTVWNSLYGFKYILDADRKSNYVQAVYEDVKSKIKIKNENTKKT